MRKLNISTVFAMGLTMVVLLLIHRSLELTEEKKQIQLDKQDLSYQLSGLHQVKEELQIEVDTLMKSYAQVTKESELLKRLLRNSKRQLTKANYNFQQFRLESSTAVQSLKESIQRLVKAKSTLESTIQVTHKANNVLLDQAGIDRRIFNKIMFESKTPEIAFVNLRKEYDYAKGERFSAATEAQLRRIKANQRPKAIDRKLFRATDFRTETEMRNGKVTAKAKRVKRVVVSFDLNEVPEEHLGIQDLYLVIKDSENKLLDENAVTVKVRKKGLLREIRVISTKKVTVERSQRIRFKFDVPKRLSEGLHKIEVYANSGLVGKTSFRVEK